MKAFDIDIKIYSFELLEPEIDIILHCLQYYMYNEYTLTGKILNEKQNSERNLIKDTYDQLIIFKQERIKDNKKNVKNNFEKFA